MRKWLAGGLAVVAVGAGITSWALDRDDEKAAAPPATVAADRGVVTAAVATTGSVQPSATRTLSFAVDATVETVRVRPGALVTKGAVLASVDDADAADAVSDAQDSLTDAEDQLADAEVAPAGTVIAAAAASGPAGTDRIFSARQRVNRARVALAEAKDALAGTAITAPIAGTVMAVAGQVGSDVGKGTTFVTLADTYAMQVSASFPEADAGSLAVGQTATVTLADRVGEEFPAKVLQLDPVGVSDGTLVTYGALLSFTKQPAGLLTGQSAAVEVTTGSVADALRVPSTAVHAVSAGQGTVRMAGGTTQQVGVGLRGDQFTQITSGLTAGQVVVRSW